MSNTITLTDLMREYKSGVGWGVEFEYLRQNKASEALQELHLVKRSGITEPVVLHPEGFVVEGHLTVYVASLLGIRDIPVEYA